MKIKIIDLLNKIANRQESINVETKYDSDDWVKDDFLLSLYIEFEHKNNYEIVKFLNDYVEIKEPKKIEKIDFGTLNTQKEKNRAMKDTINKLIDEINNLKDK